MKKIACYKCSHSVDVSEAKAFSTIKCPACEQELCIPEVIGTFILTEKISSNRFYETFKGHKDDSDELLIFKKVNSFCELNDTRFTKLKEKLSKVNGEGKLELTKVAENYIAYRPFYETSINEYLKASRPKSEKALYILDQTAELLQKYTEQQTFPADLMPGNLLMDKDGRIILSDLLFRESLYEVLEVESKSSLLNPHCTSLNYLRGEERTIEDSIFAFGCLAYVLCCGNYPWPFGSIELTKKARKIKPEVLLDLRGENPDSLKLLIKTLIDEEKDEVSSFNQIQDVLGTKQIKKNKETPAIKSPIKKKAVKPVKASFKNRNKRKRKSSNAVPVLFVFAALLAISAFIILNVKKEKEPTVVAVKKEENKVIKPPKKVTIKKEQKAEPLIVKKEVEKPEIKEVEKLPPKIDRESIKAELMPPDFNFDPLVGKLDEYIEATKQEERELEEDKIEIVSMYRDHILIHLYKRKYNGLIHLQGKETLRAEVVKADENNIHIINLQNKKPLVVTWKDLEFNQFEEFANYYAASFTEDFSLSDDNELVFKKVAEEYISLAVVLDWYGFKKEAVKYKKKALQFDTSQIAKLDLMIKEDPTN